MAESIDISQVDMSLITDSPPYTGSAVCPMVITSLTLGRDYEVEYSNNILVTTEAQALIKGIGNFTGQRILWFNIVPQTIEIAIVTCGDADVLGCFDLTNLQVMVNRRILTKDVDYTYTIEKSIRGIYETSNLTIIGIGNYTGERTESIDTGRAILDLSKHEFYLTNPEIEYTYDGQPKTPDISNDDGLEFNTHYYITWRNNINAGSKAEAVAVGLYDYTNESIAYFTINPKNISDGISIDCPLKANGTYNILKLKVYNNNIALRLNKDYTLDKQLRVYDYSIDIHITVKGIGNYTGEYSPENDFKIGTTQQGYPVPGNGYEFEPGQAVFLTNVALYSRAASKIYEDIISGTHYIWNTDICNSRIRLTSTQDAAEVPGMIEGWVYLQDIINNSEEFRVGDVVYCTGYLKEDPEGLGLNIGIASTTPLYITDIGNFSSLGYPIGVSTAINRNRIGWAAINTLSHSEPKGV